MNASVKGTNTHMWECISTVTWVYTNTHARELNWYSPDWTRPDQTRPDQTHFKSFLSIDTHGRQQDAKSEFLPKRGSEKSDLSTTYNSDVVFCIDKCLTVLCAFFAHSLREGWEEHNVRTLIFRESSVSWYLLCYSRFCTFFRKNSGS